MEVTKKQILTAIVTDFYDDLEFIENVNNLTWARKAQLRQLNQDNNGKKTNAAN